MKIKKFSAPTMKEGKAKIIKELGNDAVILSSRTVESAESGAKYVEIVAAVDDRPAASNVQLRRLREPAAIPALESAVEKPEPAEPAAQSNMKIHSELESIRVSISELADAVKYKFAPALGPNWARLYKALSDMDFSEDFILGAIGKVSSVNPFAEISAALTETKKLIANSIPLFPTIVPGPERQVITFLGTAGGGKTSALIKLAVICKLVHKADILIVSTDSYKVGGAEQLQTFSAIASIPFKAVYSPEELKALLDKEFERNLIFIDTTGKSQNDRENMELLGEFLKAAEPNVNYLVQSACSTGKAITDCIEKFSAFNLSAMILTKTDEAPAIGQAVEALQKSRLPLAYFTNGQQVPDDIEPATIKNIAHFTFASLDEEKI